MYYSSVQAPVRTSPDKNTPRKWARNKLVQSIVQLRILLKFGMWMHYKYRKHELDNALPVKFDE